MVKTNTWVEEEEHSLLMERRIDTEVIMSPLSPFHRR